jgi:hypothetical protein
MGSTIGSGLVGYSDSDWAGDVRDAKSTTGLFFQYDGAPVLWISRKQDCVSLSSTEAEYVALSEAVKECLWIRALLQEMGEFSAMPKATTIYEDNQGCLKLATTECFEKRTKHINVRFNFVKEQKDRGAVVYEYCPTESMVADILTKPLASIKIKRFAEMMGLRG